MNRYLYHSSKSDSRSPQWRQVHNFLFIPMNKNLLLSQEAVVRCIVLWLCVLRERVTRVLTPAWPCSQLNLNVSTLLTLAFQKGFMLDVVHVFNWQTWNYGIKPTPPQGRVSGPILWWPGSTVYLGPSEPQDHRVVWGSDFLSPLVGKSQKEKEKEAPQFLNF